MNQRTITLLLAVAFGCSGCVSFSGPRDLCVQLENAGDVTLHEEEGVCVGALAIGFANLVAGPWLPVSLSGVSTVDYAEYRVEPRCGGADSMCLRDLELNGWETFLRVRDANSQMVVMVEERGASVSGMLFLEQTGDELQVVRARGNFEQIIDSLMSSDLLDGFDERALLLSLDDL